MSGRWNVVALATALGGLIAVPAADSAYSQTTSQESLSACFPNDGGRVRIVGSVTECRDTETAVSWNVQGPPGPEGPPGPPGPQGAPGPAGSADEPQRNLARELGVTLHEYRIAPEALAPADCDAGAGARMVAGGSDLGPVVGFMGAERVHSPYRVIVAFERLSADLQIQDIVGQAATVFVNLGGAGIPGAEFDGIVTGMALSEASADGATYVAVLEPVLSRLSIGNDFRAYSDMQPSDIVTSVLSEAGIAASVPGGDAARRHVVQWMESDLAFITRLMDEEGLFYFLAEDGRFVAVASTAGFVETGLTLSYRGSFPPLDAGTLVASSFRTGDSTVPEGVTVYGWNPEKKEEVTGNAGTSGVSLRFDASVQSSDAASTRADADLRRARAEGISVGGTSSVPTLRAGRTIAVLGDSASTAAFDGSYAITAVRHVLVAEEDTGCFSYGNSFSAIPVSVPYQPPRLPPPRVAGPQNAIVTNNLDPDGLGRVKVVFPWDRDVETAWIRVVFPSGERPEGTSFIPEIGDEVLVTFVNGDPDRPLVMGALYNGVDIPPVSAR